MVRRIALLGALVLFVVAPAAHAKPSHLLKLYKVEQHVDLEGEDGFYEVACRGTDIAVDGMYRIDAVDQDNEFTRLELLRSVYQVAAYPASDSSYRFRFTPTLGGDAQVKLWVTCLGRENAENNHQHSWSLTMPQQAFVQALPAGPVAFDHGLSCPAGSIAVQPGWRVVFPLDVTLTPFRSYPTSTFRSWHYAFVIDAPVTLQVYISCLPLKSSSVNGHAHRIVQRWKPGFAGSPRVLPVTDNRREQDLHCGEHYKGMLGGWWINDPFHTWWFGMEPRIKSRTYWFAHEFGGSPNVFLGLACFKDRTT